MYLKKPECIILYVFFQKPIFHCVEHRYASGRQAERDKWDAIAAKRSCHNADPTASERKGKLCLV